MEQKTGDLQGKAKREKNLEKGVQYRFKPGESGNPAGRPKKMLTTIREKEGFQRMSLSQVTDIIQDMIGLTVDELRQIFEDENSSIVEKIIANALKTDITNGNLSNLEVIAARAWGKANQRLIHEGIPEGKFKVEITRPKLEEDEDESEDQKEA